MKDILRNVLALMVVSFTVMSSYATDKVAVISNADNTLPLALSAQTRVTVVNIGAPASDEFADICGKYCKIKVIGTGTRAITQSQIADCQKSDAVIAALYSSSAESVKNLDNLLATGRRTVVVFMLPQNQITAFGDLSRASAIVVASGSSTQLQSLAAQAVFGGVAVTGRVTVPVRGVCDSNYGLRLTQSRLGFASPASEGFTPGMEASIDSIVRINIARKSFPGCQVVVVKDGNVVLDKSYGRLTYSPSSPKVTDGTLYDVASMTKATATLGGLMAAYDDGLFSIDAPASRYITELRGTDKSSITVRDLLFHQSGLPAVIDKFKLMADPASYTGKLYGYKYGAPLTVKLDRNFYGNANARLRTDVTSSSRSSRFPYEMARGIYTGDGLRKVLMDAIYEKKAGQKKYNYSDLNFCLLMQMEENLTGRTHDDWVKSRVFGPIGAWHTGYRPSTYYNVAEIAPTEKDDFMRRQLLQGYVHDEIAAMSGGVQGNAGLFANALDIAKLCQTWLNGGTYGNQRIFKPQTVKLFTEAYNPTSKRGLGFDRAARLKSMDELNLPLSTYGHIGFTGTCFWVDPESRLIYVFLCNRVYPSRDNKAFNELMPRTEILRAVYSHLPR